ncbi:unnamed protein product [Meloidogyne enterolobii]|uniref:Uncharacterized protein n=1 Tax=Meloidogyne enterolobii TaxID=390850 RepID=A0ACB0Z0N3_MELEN
MSEDRKIIEYEGVKYYKEEGQWFQLQMYPVGEDKVPDAIKIRKSKFDLPPEIQLDVFKCHDFTQLLDVQQTSVYFKKFVNEHGKVLARKEFDKLEIFSIDDPNINERKRRHPRIKLYDFKLDEDKRDFGFCDQKKLNFIKIEREFYDFELTGELEKKWKRGIEQSIPMFLQTVGKGNFEVAVFQLEQNYYSERELYYFQLSKYPKNIEEMKIARYFFQLLFNCSFHLFIIHIVVINPKMIELLFGDDIKVPLQIHSQKTYLYLYELNSLNFVWNHLVTNHIFVDICSVVFDMENYVGILFKILAYGGNKFSSITLEVLDSKLYNFIIEHIETALDITKIVKRIKFVAMYGPLLSSKIAKNLQVTVKGDVQYTRFQLFNIYNPKIEFSVYIKEGYGFVYVPPGSENKLPAFRVLIVRIE